MEFGWQTVHGTCPSKSNCYKVIAIGGHSSLAKTGALKDYENKFYLECGPYRNKEIKGFFEYHVRVYYPSMRSDLDNSLKIQLDCLQKTNTIKNDNLCVKIVAEKFVDKENPRIEFKIITID